MTRCCIALLVSLISLSCLNVKAVSVYNRTTHPSNLLLKTALTTALNRYELTSCVDEVELQLTDNHLKSFIPIVLTSTRLSNDDIVKLEWTASAAGEEYHIMRDDASGLGFIDIGTTYGLVFYDTISYPYCNYTTFSYRIESTAGISNIEFESLSNFRPEDPTLKVVTIDNGIAQLYWSPSQSDAVNEYIIERNLPPWTTYYVTGNTDTLYIDNDIGNVNYTDPCSNIIIYNVRAKDLCGAESPGDNKLVSHNNILLKGNTSDLCERKAKLQWNSYKNMNPPVTSYKVQKSSDGVNFSDYDVVNSEQGKENYEYVDTLILSPFKSIYYRIEALNVNNLSSVSCVVALLPTPDTLTSFRINNVTVTDNTFITLTAESEPKTIPAAVEIYRTDVTNSQPLTSLPWNDTGILTFEDNNVDVNAQSYIYSIKALDECGFEIASGNSFNSLLLTIMVDNNNNVSLYWNNHLGWGDELQNYLVYKYNDGVLVSGYPVTVDASLTGYDETDNSGAIKTTYVIEAVNTSGIASRSNEVLLPRNAEVNVPTAFRPLSLYPENREFNPLLKNIDPTAYIFVIYNRWGQQIFETHDPSKGWDGSYRGEIQQGIYIYQISYRDQAGVNQIKRGSLILIK